MRDISEVAIESVIVHILDSSGKDKTVYSSVPIDLKGNPALVEYFRDQIVKTSQDELAAMADLGDEEVASLYEDIISKSSDPHLEKEFVEASESLGRRLNGFMEEDKRIVPGVLVICVFTADNGNGGSMLALLKLNITHAIKHEAERIDEEKWKVTLLDIPDALPTAGERLQKAALVKKLKNQKWEMLVLDRQVAKRGELRAADFFRKFLGAQWRLTPRTQTYRIFGALTGIAAKLYKTDDPENWSAADSIYQSLDEVLRSESADLSRVVHDMDVQEDTKQDIEEEFERMELGEVKRMELGGEIPIDPDTAGKLAANVRFRGDGDLMLTAPSDAYNQSVRVEDIVKENLPFKQVTIITRFWKRVRPRKR